MSNNPRLEDRIRSEVRRWLEAEGADFVSQIRDFCQGNRASLTQVMAMVNQLGTRVFVGEGDTLNEELLEKLEYGVFDLIGKFSSTPGGSDLVIAIEKNIVRHITEIFAEAKKEWNLSTYKITASYEELDPNNSRIPAADNYEFEFDEVEIPVDGIKNPKNQARQFLDELVAFAKVKLRGEKNRTIAINWLENPEKQRDYYWLASLTDSSPGSIKVTLTRLKHTLCKNYHLSYNNDQLTLNRSTAVAKSHSN